MAVTVKIPTQLRAAAGGESELEVDGATVGEVLDALFDRHGELRERIAGDDGAPRRFVNVYLRGEDIRFLDGLSTPVSDGDGGLRRFVNVYVDGEDIHFTDGLETAVADGNEVQILPAVAGG